MRVRVGAALAALAPQREALVLWGTSFGLILVSYAVIPAYSKLVATISFLYLPQVPMRARNEDYRDYGIQLAGLPRSLAYFAACSAVVFPLFACAFWGFVHLLAHLPDGLSSWITPLPSTYHFAPRLPARFPEWVVDQLFVVALPEEFFYRGFLQQRFQLAWPTDRRIFGVRVGRAFLVTALLFALGHLAIWRVWRLSVFFPALLFGWLKERTGSVIAPTLFHASCNLFEMILEASFFGA